jgi:hypothetical protein
MQPIPCDSIMNEFSKAQLGDQRLTKRLCQLAEDFAEQPEVSIPKASGDWGQTCAAYRFLDNEQVRPADILAAHQGRTVERAATVPLLLAVSDTTSLNYSQHAATSGLGPIRTSRSKTFGLWLHNLVAFTPQGVSLGVLDAQCWARDPAAFGSRHQRRNKPIEQKESYKWVHSLQILQRLAAQTPHTRWVMIADREADLYELFERAQQQPQGPSLLVRANHDRNLVDRQRSLFAHLARAAVAGAVHVPVPRRRGQPARTATLTVRFRALRLKQPGGKGQRPSLTLWAVEARELHPPPGIRPIHWRLLSPLPVGTLAEAVEKLQWYCVRWSIEVFHKVLKSGCRVEAVQLQQAARLKRYLAIKLVVAWRVMALMKLGREQPERELSEILEEEEWRALQAVEYARKTYRGQKRSRGMPTLGEGIRWLARLGGHLGRKGDGAPGPLSLARGLERLHDITVGWKLARAAK